MAYTLEGLLHTESHACLKSKPLSSALHPDGRQAVAAFLANPDFVAQTFMTPT